MIFSLLIITHWFLNPILYTSIIIYTFYCFIPPSLLVSYSHSFSDPSPSPLWVSFFQPSCFVFFLCFALFSKGKIEYFLFSFISFHSWIPFYNFIIDNLSLLLSLPILIVGFLLLAPVAGFFHATLFPVSRQFFCNFWLIKLSEVVETIITTQSEEVKRLRYLISNLTNFQVLFHWCTQDKDARKMIGHAKQRDELYYLEWLNYSSTQNGYNRYHLP